MSAKGNDMVKKCAFIVLILAILAGAVFYFAYGRQEIHCVTGINNLDHYTCSVGAVII